MLEAVDRGDLDLQHAEDLARGLHPRAGGNFMRAKALPNFKYDRTILRFVLADWFQYDWPEDGSNESGVTFEKLQQVLKDIGLELQKTGEEVTLRGVHNEGETKRCIGPDGWDALLEAFDVGTISLAKADTIATKLNPYTGGWFKRLQSLPNFNFNRQTFKGILMDWAARIRNEELITLEVIQKVLEDPDVGLKLEEIPGAEFQFHVIETTETRAESSRHTADNNLDEVLLRHMIKPHRGTGNINMINH